MTSAVSDQSPKLPQGLEPITTDAYTLTLRPGFTDLLDLDWVHSITEWTDSRLIDLPRGISRHEVRFVATGKGIYAIKELPLRAANREFEMLTQLEELAGPSVIALGLVVRPQVDRYSDQSAALITRYVDHSFSYRELLSGPGFGPRRAQLLDAFAGLLAELHMLTGQPVLYCRSGDRTKELSAKLAAQGMPVAFLEGGILAWEAEGLPIEK